MKKSYIQIISSGKGCVWLWENESLMNAIRDDPRYQAMGIGWDVICFRDAKKSDAIIVSLIRKEDQEIAKEIIEDSYTNPKHFMFCETNLFLGMRKQTPSGKQGFEVIPFHRLSHERILEVITMMLEEFQ